MTDPNRFPRQTLSYLRQLFEERGIRPKNKLGQNFLIDLNLVDLLLRTAELTRDDLAVEIGTGTGSLTARLAEQAGAVLGVEVDPAFHILTREAIAGHEDRVLGPPRRGEQGEQGQGTRDPAARGDGVS